MFATAFERWTYRHIAKPFFFRRDPEEVHDRMCAVGTILGKSPFARKLTRHVFAYAHPMLKQTLLGITFPNPIGLTAGFDKNAQLTDIVSEVGFGFEEVGSITGEPCEGNPKPRLWRLPKSQGLVVWYGLKNDGCEAIAERLANKQFALPVGTSIARTNSPQTVDDINGINDYVKAFRAFADIGDYTTINISCPNTCGGEPFTDPVRLDALLTRLDTIPSNKPIFLKLPCDSTLEQLDALIRTADSHRVHGLILSNLTKRRDLPGINQNEIADKPKGGISGRPTFSASNALIAHAYATAGSRYIIIGSGGIFSAEDAYQKIRNGASLLQLATGMIFEGPQVIGEINKGLTRLLKRDGFTHISQAVGTGISNSVN